MSAQEDDCGCFTEEEPVIVCVELFEGVYGQLTECIVDCLMAQGEEITVVDCEDIDLGDLEDDFPGDWEPDTTGLGDDFPGDWGDGFPGDWEVDTTGDFVITDGEDDFPSDIDCDCDTEEEPIIVCVEIEEGFIAPMPECIFNCLVEAEEELVLVDCDDIVIEDGEGDFPGDLDCDCEYEEEPVMVCVQIDEGFIAPMPECIFNCLVDAGEELLLVDCGDIIIIEGEDDFPGDWGDDFPSDCEGEEQSICVDLYGEIVELNQCEYDLLIEFEVELTIIDCGGIIEDDSDVVLSSGTDNIDSFVIYPNPTTGDNVTVSFVSEKESYIDIIVTDITGKVISNSSLIVNVGATIETLNFDNLDSGMYTVSLSNANGIIETKRLVKN